MRDSRMKRIYARSKRREDYGWKNMECTIIRRRERVDYRFVKRKENCERMRGKITRKDDGKNI